MSRRHIWIVFKKEVRDIIRDKKTLITSILVPMLIIPFMNILIGGGIENLQKGINENITIGLSEDSRTNEIKDLLINDILKDNKDIKLVEDIGDSVEAIRNEKVRIVLDFDKDYAEKLDQNRPFTIRLMYDESKTKSQGSVSIVSNIIRNYNNTIVAKRLEELGVSTDILMPANIEEKNVAEKDSNNMFLSMILPLMIVVFIASGGIPAATDLIAGEKERNTFEPLLTTRPKRMSILIGKYLTVTLFSFTTVIATLGGFIVSYIINPKALSMGSDSEIAGFSMPLGAIVLTILISIALGLIFAGIQITLSTYSRSFKEAQTYLGFLTILVIIPAYGTMFTQAGDMSTYMFLTPIVNTIAAIKMVLGGTIVYSKLALALGSSIVYVIATSILAAWMFTREKVLFRS